MLRFMCFVGFAWPECKTKRHFILCNVSFFLPWLEVEQGMAEGVTLCLSGSHKEILLLRLYSDSAFTKWVFMSILNYKFYKKCGINKTAYYNYFITNEFVINNRLCQMNL